MPIEYTERDCPTCGDVRRADRNAPNNLLHLALTAVTGGAWLFVWLIVSVLREPWRCSVCGRKVGGGGCTGCLLALVLIAVLALFVFWLVEEVRPR